MMRRDEVATLSMHEYCSRYFAHVGATIQPSPADTLCVVLPRDVDKELTDRPFYWMWVEAMGETPPNTILYLKFHEQADESAAPEGVKPELIVPGCYRLLRIYASAKARGTFATAYEPAPLVTPYAVFVVKISFIADSRRDFLESYAIDLRDYRIYGDAIGALDQRQLVDERPMSTRILPVPLDIDQVFGIASACARMDVEARDHTWAVDARHRLNEELTKLDDYYASLIAADQNSDDDKTAWDTVIAEQELRRAEIMWRMEPKIEVRTTQFAIVYLATPPVLT